MLIGLGMKFGGETPCGMPEMKEEEHFPSLHLELDSKKMELLEGLSTKGTAKISYEIERISKEKRGDKTHGSVVLKIISIEPTSERVKKEPEEVIEENSEEALDSFMLKIKNK